MHSPCSFNRSSDKLVELIELHIYEISSRKQYQLFIESESSLELLRKSIISQLRIRNFSFFNTNCTAILSKTAEKQILIKQIITDNYSIFIKRLQHSKLNLQNQPLKQTQNQIINIDLSHFLADSSNSPNNDSLNPYQINQNKPYSLSQNNSLNTLLNISQKTIYSNEVNVDFKTMNQEPSVNQKKEFLQNLQKSTSNDQKVNQINTNKQLKQGKQFNPKPKVNFLKSLEEEWLCPISQASIKQPYSTQAGHAYQKSHIEKWQKQKYTQPQTRQKCFKIILNWPLKNIIVKFNQMAQQFQKQHTQNLAQIQKLLLKQIQQKEDIIQFLRSFSNQSCINSEKIENSNKEFSFSRQTNHSMEDEQNEVRIMSSQPRNQEKNGKIEILIKSLEQSKRQLQIKKQAKYFQFYPDFTKGEYANANAVKEEQKKKQITLKLNGKYIFQTFKSKRQFTQKYWYNEQKNLYGLDHSNITLKISSFLEYEWRFTYYLNFSNCDLKDNQWQLLARNAQIYFPNLQQLELSKNKIKTVKQSQLNNFKKLKYINFVLYGQFNNPLSNQSKKQLRNFKRHNQEITVNF